jgi:hypothetical protein
MKSQSKALMKKSLKATILASGALVALCGSSNAASTLSNGLVNYWNFDDNLTDQAHGLPGSASTVQDDGSFAGANGTGGISYAPGLFGSATSQDGASGAAENNGFVEVPRSGDTLYGTGTAHTANTLTTSIWVNSAGFDTSWQSVISHGEGEQYRIARRGGSNFAGYAGGVGEGPEGSQAINSGWHHILAISEGGLSTRLWIDGILDSTGGAPVINDQGNSAAPGGTTPNLNIGANPQTGGQNREWNGLLDDVAQWNRVLTDEEIQALYGGGPNSAQSLETLLAVPEPSSALLGFLGLSFLFRRRRQTLD